jgi:hypothetical protein
MASSELQMAILQAQTRRHFLRSLGTGMGSIFLGSSLLNYAAAETASPVEKSSLSFSRDATAPLSQLPPQFLQK